MNTLIASLAFLAVASAAPSGILGHDGTLVVGPSGVVTGHGPIGPLGLGLNGYYGPYGHHGAGSVVVGPSSGGSIITGPSSPGAVVGPHYGLGYYGRGFGYGYGHGDGVVIKGPSGTIRAAGPYGHGYYGHW